MKRFSKITTTQLARICGVSQGTVDRALHNRGGINQETKKRILDVAKEYDYIPTAKGSNSSHSMLIGVVLFDLYNQYFSRLAMELVKTAREFNYSILFQFSEKNPENEKSAIEYFDYIGVDGIILFSVGSDSEDYLNYLRSIKKPLILIGNRMEGLRYVGIDDSQAMFDLTMRFTQQSFQGDLVYYAPILKEKLHSLNAQKLRLEGFIKAAKAMDKSYRVALSSDELQNVGALIASTDHHLIKALNCLAYPHNIPLAGFDNSDLLKMLPVPILTVECHTENIAKECMNYLLGRDYKATVSHDTVYSNNN